MQVIEVILFGQVEGELSPLYNWDKVFKVKIEDLSVTQLEIRINRKLILYLETRNLLGDIVPINQYLFRGNHLIASSITSKEQDPSESMEKRIKRLEKEKEKELDPKKLVELRIQLEIAKEQYYKIKDGKLIPVKNKTRYIYGIINLLNNENLGEKTDITTVLWERYERKLENSVQDFKDLEKEYSDRFDSLQLRFKRLSERQQQTIEELQKKLILQPIAYAHKVTNVISGSILNKIEGDHMASPKLRSEITNVKEHLKEKRE